MLKNLFQKKITVLLSIFLTFSITTIYCQETGASNSVSPDIFIPDSLHNKFQDMIFSDSLNISRKEEITDSTGIDTAQLKKDVRETILQKKRARKKLNLPFLDYREYFHIKSPFEEQLLFRKNNFTFIPFKISSIHEFQNYAPYYQIQYLTDQIIFEQKDYELPVSLTDSYLALGDHDMNHVFASFQKGKILNIENLNLKFDVLSFDGLWLNENERAKNIDLHLFYRFDRGKLHFYHTMIDQEISSQKLSAYEEEISVINEFSADYSFLWENPLVDVGYSYNKRRIKSENQKQSQFLLKKSLQSKTHSVTGYFEYFLQTEPADSTFFTGSLFQNSEIFDFKFSNSVYYQNEDNFLFSSKIKRNFYKSFGLIGKYSKKKLDFFLEKTGIGLTINPFFMENEIIIGEQRFNEVKKFFAEITNYMDLNFSDFTLNIKKWTMFREFDKNLQNYPDLQSKTYFEFIYHLKYNNALKFGFSHFYCADFSAEEIIERSFNIDAYFAIQVTDQFEFKLDAINLTNVKDLFGNTIPGTHLNIGVNWIFVN